MQISQNKMLGLAAAALLLGLGYWLSSPNPQLPAQEMSKNQPVVSSEQPLIPVSEPRLLSLEVDTAIDVDWSACTDNYGSEECLLAITPLIAEVDVVGDLSWIDLIDRFDDNLKVISQVVEDPSCIPPATGLDPIAEHSQTESADKTAGRATANCGAEAFSELGALMQRCHNDPRRSPPTEEEMLVEASRRGITDLALLYEVEQSARYGKIEETWLDKECASLTVAMQSMPTLYHQLGISDEKVRRRDSDFLDKPFRIKQIFISRAYIERAVLLGDFRLAQHYLKSAKLTSSLLGPDRVNGYEGEEFMYEKVKQRDQEVEQVLDKLVTHVPEVGFAAKATHLVQRYPSLSFTNPRELADIREQNESPDRTKGYPKKFIPEDDWYQRALDIATYGIAADRMNGVPADLPSNPLQSDVFHSDFWRSGDKISFLIRHLDANDWEYASQKANELVAAAKQRQNTP